MNDNPNLDRLKILDCDRKAVLGLPSGAVHIWFTYYMSENSTQQAYPDTETLMEITKLDKKTVIKWRKYLVANGWLVWTGEYAADMYTKPTRGARKVKVYRVDDPTRDKHLECTPSAPPVRNDCATTAEASRETPARDPRDQGVTDAMSARSVHVKCTSGALQGAHQGSIEGKGKETLPPTRESGGNIPPIDGFRWKCLLPKNSPEDSCSCSGSDSDSDSCSDSRSCSARLASAASQQKSVMVASLQNPQTLNPKVNPNDRTNTAGGNPLQPPCGDMVGFDGQEFETKYEGKTYRCKATPAFLSLKPETPCLDCQKPLGVYGSGTAAGHSECDGDLTDASRAQSFWIRGKVDYNIIDEEDPSPVPRPPSHEEQMQAMQDALHNRGKKPQFFPDGAAYPPHWYRLSSDEKRQMVALHRKKKAGIREKAS